MRTKELPTQPELIEDHAVKEELISYENQIRKISLFYVLLPPMQITEFLLSYIKERSLLQKSVRVLSWMILATKKMRKEKVEFGEIFQEMWKGVMKALISEHQEAFWTSEMELLRAKREVKTLRTMRPFLDHDGLMRMNSRLNGCWWMSYETKNPYILQNKGEFVLLLLRHVHVERLKHYGGPSQLLGYLRETTG